jgi:hypothetical protein
MSSRTQALLLAAITVLGFAINLGTAWKFDSAGLLADDDLIFNADGQTYRMEFVWGGGDFDRGWGGRTYKHPNLTNFINPPVRALAAVISKAGLVSDQRAAKHAVALCISPLAAALTTIALFLALRALQVGPAIALLVCLLDAVCFARVVYGSLPESFALAGLGTTLIVLLAAWQRNGARPPSFVVWLAASVFAAGVTITNLIPLALLHFGAQRAGTARARAFATGKLAAATLVLTAALAVPLALAYRGATEHVETGSIADQLRRGVVRDLGHYHGFDGSQLVLFPLTVLTSLVPPQPVIAWNLPQSAEISISYLPRARQLWPYGLPALAGFALLLYAARRAPAAWPVASGCAAILGVYWFLHLFYGDELFLYALHWQAPLLVLVAAAAAALGTLRRGAGVVALAVLVGIAALLSARVVPRMLQQWEAAQVERAPASSAS